MNKLITWQELADYVPEYISFRSDKLDQKNIELRSYEYKGQDVMVPAPKPTTMIIASTS